MCFSAAPQATRSTGLLLEGSRRGAGLDLAGASEKNWSQPRLKEVRPVAKRMMVNFSKKGFPQYEQVEEEGMAKPCAMGLPWVNLHTIQTLEKRNIEPTGPKGEPLEEAPKT